MFVGQWEYFLFILLLDGSPVLTLSLRAYGSHHFLLPPLHGRPNTVSMLPRVHGLC